LVTDTKRREFENRMLWSQNRMLWRIFGPNRYEIIRSLRKLRDGELHNVYASTNIIIMVESRRITWAGHVAYMGESEEKCAQNFGGRTKKKQTTRKMYA
jgi:hypothetical protein